jgi:uncharacterized membrane protein YbhN (UPF0104 family)
MKPSHLTHAGDEVHGWTRLWRRGRAWLLTLVAVSAVAGYLMSHGEALAILKGVRAATLMSLVGIYLARTLCVALQHRLALSATGTRLGIVEVFWLRAAAGGLNLIIPFNGGVGAQAVYLNKAHGVRYQTFVPLLIIMRLVALTATVLVGVGCLAWLSPPGPFRTVVLIATTVLIAGNLIVLGLGWNRAAIGPSGEHPSREQSAGALRRVSAGMIRYWPYLPRLLMLSLAVCLVDATALAIACRAAGFEVTWAGVASVAMGGMLVAFVPLTPASLGTFEAAIGLAAPAAGLTGVEGVAAAVICRAGDLLRTLLVAPLAAYFLSRGHRHAWQVGVPDAQGNSPKNQPGNSRMNNSAAPYRKIVLIVGSNRTGTSLLVEILLAANFRVPGDMVTDSRGYQVYESRQFKEISRRWNWKRARQFVDTLQGDQAGDQIVLKYPKASRVLKRWLKLIPDARIIYVYRPREETVASQVKNFWGDRPGKFLARWLYRWEWIRGYMSVSDLSVPVDFVTFEELKRTRNWTPPASFGWEERSEVGIANQAA